MREDAGYGCSAIMMNREEPRVVCTYKKREEPDPEVPVYIYK